MQCFQRGRKLGTWSQFKSQFPNSGLEALYSMEKGFFNANKKIKITGKPLLHWPEDTVVEEGVWRDYYSGEKLGDFEKPWKKLHDERFGEGTDCLGLSTWWPDYDFVLQFDQSWWEGSCTSSWRGCPGNNRVSFLSFMKSTFITITQVVRARMMNCHPCSL